MALDQPQLVLSLFVFALYLITIFLLFGIRKKLKGDSKIAFTFFIVSILVVSIRRLQQIFSESQILSPIPYSAEIVTIMFALTFFLGVFYIHKSIHVGKSSRSAMNKTKPWGIKFLLGVLATIILINLFYRFGLINLTEFFQPDVLTIIALLFVATEMGFRNALNKKAGKKPSKTELFGMVIVAMLFLALILGWFGLVFSFINISKILLEFLLLVFVIIEILK
jgi:hypothetical protein